MWYVIASFNFYTLNGIFAHCSSRRLNLRNKKLMRMRHNNKTAASGLKLYVEINAISETVTIQYECTIT